MREILLKLAKLVQSNNGELFLVGGAVRDKILNRPIKDYDCECYNLEQQKLVELLENFSKIHRCSLSFVGESFKVFKLRDLEGFEIDIALPRTERSTGKKHGDFEVTSHPYLSYEISSRRRDFTMNAMLYHILNNKLIDPYGGQKDIQSKVIRVVDPETFVEDSLRVLRAMQFAARFNFSIDADTVKLCQSIDLSDLPAERLGGEIEKWFLSKHPSIGMKYFVELGIYKLFPFDTYITSDPDLFSKITDHIGQAMDFFLTCKGRPSQNGYKQALFICFLTNLFYTAGDLEKFLDLLKIYSVDGYDVRKKVMQIAMNSNDAFTDSEIRRESTKKDLQLFFDFKICERVVLKQSSKDLIIAESRAEQLNCLKSPLQPLLMGKHVLELGVPEGKKVGEICKAVFELQLDGKINTVEEAVEVARSLI